MLRSLAPLLGCGLMMLVCMAVMATAGTRNRRNEPNPPAPPSDEVAELRDEVARLRRLDDQRRATAEDPTP